jgi:hypothetical protein
MSRVFIDPPNQQFDEGIAPSLQFCDSSECKHRRAEFHQRKFFALVLRPPPLCHTPVVRTSQGGKRA